MAAIVCEGVRRHFGEVRALDGVDLTVDEHQIFGILGPNGSGKTTLLNQIQGLDAPTSGTVRVLGLDPTAQRTELMLRMGSQLQESTMIPRLTAREALETFAAFYPSTRPSSEVLEQLGLTSKANERVERLSGGQRQRLFIALALQHDPDLLVFDELTSAVDPQARQAIWDVLRDLREQGRTILLTTHSMEEAQALCDRLVILDEGRIIAEGTPRELIAEHAGGSTLRLVLSGDPDLDTIRGIEGVRDVTRDGEAFVISGSGPFAPKVVALLAREGVEVTDMTTTEATLEDVFLALTGRTLREGD